MPEQHLTEIVPKFELPINLEQKITAKELQNLGPMKIHHENASPENLNLGAKEVGTDNKSFKDS